MLLLVALAIRVWFSLLDGHRVICTTGDASEYIRGAGAFSSVLERLPGLWVMCQNHITDLSHLEVSAFSRAILEPLSGLLTQGGPVYPLMILCSQKIFTPFLGADAAISGPVVSQCVLSALTCVLIGMIGTRCWNRNVGLLAMALAVFYPGFIVNSARLLSETTACFFLCAGSLLAIEAFKKGSGRPAFLSGAFMAFSQVTRSVLVLASALSLGLLCMSRLTGRNLPAKKTAVAFIAGIAVVILPVMSMQYLSTGSSSFVQDRQGAYNLVVGQNTKSLGWLSFPYPDFRETVGGTFISIIASRVKNSTKQFVSLMLDKPVRLLKHPWNDFKTPIGAIGIEFQALYHQLCILLATIGLALGLFMTDPRGQPPDKTELLSRLFVLSVAALHIAYFFFPAMARYGINAMPFLLIFSAAGLNALGSLLRSDRSSTTGLFVIASALAFLLAIKADTTALTLPLPLVPSFTAAFLSATAIKILAGSVLLAALLQAARHAKSNERATRAVTMVAAITMAPLAILPLAAHGRVSEWHVTVDDRRPAISQEVKLPDTVRETNDCYALIDCEDWRALGQSLKLTINGTSLEEVAPLFPFIQNLSEMKGRKQDRYLECERIFRHLVSAAGGSDMNLRQWFFAKIPKHIISSTSGLQSITVGVSRNGHLSARLFGSYIRRKGQIDVPSLHLVSWEKCFYGVENDTGLSDCRFTERYAIEGLEESNKDLSDQPGLQTGQYNIRLLAVPRKKGATKNHGRQVNGPQTSIFETALTLQTVPDYDQESVWIVSFQGHFLESGLSDSYCVPVSVIARVTSKSDSGVESYTSPWVPSSVLVTKGENTVRFAFPFKPSSLKGQISSVELSIRAGGSADSTQYFGVQKSQTTQARPADPVWTDCSLKVTEMTSNPLDSEAQVF